jgi:hypothetical protein
MKCVVRTTALPALALRMRSHVARLEYGSIPDHEQGGGRFNQARVCACAARMEVLHNAHVTKKLNLPLVGSSRKTTFGSPIKALGGGGMENDRI